MVTLPQATFSSCGLPAALSETPVLSACAASGHLSPLGAVLGELPLSSPYLLQGCLPKGQLSFFVAPGPIAFFREKD